MKKTIFLFSFILVFTACQKLLPPLPANDQVLDGPVDGLTPAQHQQFLKGDAAFTEVFTPEKGLGPYFVATACVTCHAGDGKGHPSTTLTRFGQYDSTGNLFMNYGAPQLQNRAIPGYLPEFIPAGAPRAKFMPPSNTGLGFLAALSDEQIMANADPTDVNGDGISGVPNFISPPSYFVAQTIHISYAGKYIGRFGKKAAAIDLLHQTVNAYQQDMGITSIFLPFEPNINGLLNPYADPVAEPEVASNTVLNLVFYLRTLKAPVQRNANSSDVIAGKTLFSNVQCAKCHTPSWTTGSSDIEALAHKTFYPYTDLLLHDMGTALDDGYTEGTAQTCEWRTPPLWGLGLAKNAQGGQYFLMHDGRATSIEEAIQMHGGEAVQSKNLYNALTGTERQQLIQFLESL